MRTNTTWTIRLYLPISFYVSIVLLRYTAMLALVLPRLRLEPAHGAEPLASVAWLGEPAQAGLSCGSENKEFSPLHADSDAQTLRGNGWILAELC
jgi:hypothetical protein